MTFGRGAGKTWTGAHWLTEQAATNPKTEWAVIASTWLDARKICVEGYSGILRAAQPGEVEGYSGTWGRVRFTNGSVIHALSADYAINRGLRGHRFDGAWLDDADACRVTLLRGGLWEAITQAVTGRILVTASRLLTGDDDPFHRFLDDLAAREDTIHVTSSTWDNAANLSPPCLAELRKRYAGTPLVEGV